MALFKKKTDDQGHEGHGGSPGMDMSPMVQMMAKAPEEQRRQMLTDRLAVFASQDEGTRTAGMTAMLQAALALPEAEYARIAESRLGVLLGMEPEQRQTLMATHASVVKSLPDDLRQKEMGVMKTAVSKLPEQPREMVMGMLKSLGMM